MKPSKDFTETVHRLSVALAPFCPAVAGRLHELRTPSATAEMTAYRVMGFVDGYCARSAPTPRQDMAMITILGLATELLSWCQQRQARLEGRDSSVVVARA